ncbi:MAG: 3-hydroxybutyryl-CoA epimerase, partial [Phaeodactylibacter sp.]|nr:3-hydroxybutyryl-CoA epimerase [Phaeodactylibacter sp.]
IKKTPIVVDDQWGFFAARVQNTYILEGITMLLEGYAPALIENLGKMAGMPKGPLQLADEFSLKLIRNYEAQAAEHYGPKYIQHPAVEALEKMINDLERPGGKSKPGFYDPATEGMPAIWSALTDHFPTVEVEPNLEELTQRLLVAQVLEALWCLQERVVNSIPEVNLGSVFGWGFPAYTGGVIQFIDRLGEAQFLALCRNLEHRFGPRFKVPSILKKGLLAGK